MNTTRPIFAAMLAVALVMAAACKDHQTVKLDGANASLAKRDTTRGLGPGDLRIATTDSAVELSLIGDSLVAGFGAATRAKIQKATDPNRVSGSGLGAGIEKMVKSTVAGALDHEMHVPLSEISDIRYEDGMLVFYGRDGKRQNYFENHGDGAKTRFDEQEAKGFIAVFKSKTGRG